MQMFKWVTLGMGMICILVVAAYLNAPHLYYMAAILVTLPAVSYAMGWYAMRGLAFASRPASHRLAAPKCPQPMNPRCADNGDGCGARSTQWLRESMSLSLACA